MTTDNVYFVFGSNLLGIHGAGAAKYAEKHYGAERGCCRGYTGHAFAIPTKRTPHISLSEMEYTSEVLRAIEVFRRDSHNSFRMTPVGTGLAGFSINDLEHAIELAGGLPPNVIPLWKHP